MKLGGLLKNKYVLYFVLFIAITNVLGYLAIRDFESLSLFVVLGLISSYFSKNMIVNLAVAILGTNVIFASKRVREGLENRKEGLQQKVEMADENEEEEGYTQNNVTPSGAAPATESEEDETIGKRIDYAATMEQAYDNLQNMLGDGGMKNLTDDTKSLMNQQKQLMKNLESMAPLMDNAKKMIEGLNMGNGQIDKLAKMIGGLTGKKKKTK
jgi:uncharacterized protein YoxC